MSTHSAYKILRLIVALFAAMQLGGCDKFVKQESENLAPFANQTIDLVGSLEYSLTDEQMLYLRDSQIIDYIAVENPYDRFLALENQVGNMLTALVAYSLQIVAISEQGTSDNEKANRLADVILELVGLVRKDEIVVNPNRDDEKIMAIIDQVRQSQDYLEALRLLQPLVNDFSAHAGRVLDEVDKEKRDLAILVDEAIDKKYAAALALRKELRTVKDDMYRTLIALSQYSLSRDPAYLKKMKSYGFVSVVVATENKKSLSVREISELHQALTAELRTITENYNQLSHDIEEYENSHLELREMVELKEDAIREARLTFVVWSRAYQKMASGKTDPAEWFDITDTGKLLFGAAKKAAGI